MIEETVKELTLEELKTKLLAEKESAKQKAEAEEKARLWAESQARLENFKADFKGLLPESVEEELGIFYHDSPSAEINYKGVKIIVTKASSPNVWDIKWLNEMLTVRSEDFAFQLLTEVFHGIDKAIRRFSIILPVAFEVYAIDDFTAKMQAEKMVIDLGLKVINDDQD